MSATDDWKQKYDALEQDYNLFRDESAQVEKMLEDELEKVKKDSTFQQKELDKVRSQVAQLANELTESQKGTRVSVDTQVRLEELGKRVEELRQERRTLEIKNDKLENQVRAAEHKVHTQAARLEELEEKVIMQSHAMNDVKDEKNEQIERLKAELRDAKEDMAALVKKRATESPPTPVLHGIVLSNSRGGTLKREKKISEFDLNGTSNGHSNGHNSSGSTTPSSLSDRTNGSVSSSSSNAASSMNDKEPTGALGDDDADGWGRVTELEEVLATERTEHDRLCEEHQALLAQFEALQNGGSSNSSESSAAPLSPHADIDDLRAKLNTQASLIHELKSQLAAAHDVNEAQHKQIEALQLSSSTTGHGHDHDHGSDDTESLHAEIERLSTELATLRHSHEDEEASLAAERTKLDHQRDDLRVEHDKRRDDWNAHMEHEQSRLDNDRRVWQAEKTKQEDDLRRERDMVHAASEAATAAAAATTATNNDNEATAAATAAAAAAAVMRETRLKALQKQTADLQTELDDKDLRLQSETAARVDAQKQITLLQARQRELDAQIRTLESKLTDVKLDMHGDLDHERSHSTELARKLAAAEEKKVLMLHEKEQAQANEVAIIREFNDFKSMIRGRWPITSPFPSDISIAPQAIPQYFLSPTSAQYSSNPRALFQPPTATISLLSPSSSPKAAAPTRPLPDLSSPAPNGIAPVGSTSSMSSTTASSTMSTPSRLATLGRASSQSRLTSTPSTSTHVTDAFSAAADAELTGTPRRVSGIPGAATRRTTMHGTPGGSSHTASGGGGTPRTTASSRLAATTSGIATSRSQEAKTRSIGTTNGGAHATTNGTTTNAGSTKRVAGAPSMLTRAPSKRGLTAHDKTTAASPPTTASTANAAANGNDPNGVDRYFSEPSKARVKASGAVALVSSAMTGGSNNHGNGNGSTTSRIGMPPPRPNHASPGTNHTTLASTAPTGATAATSAMRPPSTFEYGPGTTKAPTTTSVKKVAGAIVTDKTSLAAAGRSQSSRTLPRAPTPAGDDDSANDAHAIATASGSSSRVTSAANSRETSPLTSPATSPLVPPPSRLQPPSLLSSTTSSIPSRLKPPTSGLKPPNGVGSTMTAPSSMPPAPTKRPTVAPKR